MCSSRRNQRKTSVTSTPVYYRLPSGRQRITVEPPRYISNPLDASSIERSRKRPTRVFARKGTEVLGETLTCSSPAFGKLSSALALLPVPPFAFHTLPFCTALRWFAVQSSLGSLFIPSHPVAHLAVNRLRLGIAIHTRHCHSLRLPHSPVTNHSLEPRPHIK